MAWAAPPVNWDTADEKVAVLLPLGVALAALVMALAMLLAAD